MPEERVRRNRGINLLSPGLKNRVAPNRMNVKMARILCEKGFPVLRFDPHGIGDSEGEIAAGNDHVMNLWGLIERGAYVQDTVISNSILRERAEVKEIIHIGQCGAAITAMLAGGLDPGVVAVALIDTPVRIVSACLNLSALYREDVTASDYINKMLDYSTWKKFLGREDKWKVLHSSLSDFLQKTRKGKKDRESEENIQGDRLNLQFLDALKNFVRSGKNAVMVFAGNDFFLKEFNDYMLPILQSNGIPDQLKVEIVPGANHIFSEEVSRDYLFAIISSWCTDGSKGGNRIIEQGGRI